MELFYSPAACSLSPHIVLREAGLPHRLQRVNLAKHSLEGGGNYLEVNPRGQVPAIRLGDGRVLTEGPAIVQYLADLNPASQLAPPAGTWERSKLQEWLNYISSELHKSFTPLFSSTASKDWKEAALAGLRQRFDGVSSELAGRTWITGETFTVADAYLFTVISWTAYVGMDLGEWPALKAYHGRVAGRPKVQDALRAEGLLR